VFIRFFADDEIMGSQIIHMFRVGIVNHLVCTKILCIIFGSVTPSLKISVSIVKMRLPHSLLVMVIIGSCKVHSYMPLLFGFYVIGE
jgi:hypothetical protein